MTDSMHVAIIMDGNGRWAQARGLPRTAGHHAGVKAVRRTVEAAAERPIHTLTVYAFSSDNWGRPAQEVRALMHLLTTKLPSEATRCAEEDIRLSVFGRRDRLPAAVLSAIADAEDRTRHGRRLHVRLALDYSAREALERAADHVANFGSNGGFIHALAAAYNAAEPVPDVDLLIRTGGEQRLSDFLLWECAYAELHFTNRPWPDFGAQDLDEALSSYAKRQRRFGRVPA